jgi:hypothetical protein
MAFKIGSSCFAKALPRVVVLSSVPDFRALAVYLTEEGESRVETTSDESSDQENSYGISLVFTDGLFAVLYSLEYVTWWL